MMHGLRAIYDTKRHRDNHDRGYVTHQIPGQAGDKAREKGADR
jgi:hypothetical protein